MMRNLPGTTGLADHQAQAVDVYRHKRLPSLTEQQEREVADEFRRVEAVLSQHAVSLRNRIDDHQVLINRDAPGAHPAASVTYDNATSGLTATEVQGAIDELASEVESADSVTYDNATSGLAATDVQGAIDELAAEVESADSVTYDNTGSGLTATDVQGAIDELAAAEPPAPVLNNVRGGFTYNAGLSGHTMSVNPSWSPITANGGSALTGNKNLATVSPLFGQIQIGIVPLYWLVFHATITFKASAAVGLRFRFYENLYVNAARSPTIVVKGDVSEITLTLSFPYLGLPATIERFSVEVQTIAGTATLTIQEFVFWIEAL